MYWNENSQILKISYICILLLMALKRADQRSVCVIAKTDLRLSCFKQIPGQVLSEQIKQKRLVRCKKLLRRRTVHKAKLMFFTDEKVFYLDPPVTDGRFGLRAKR